MNENESFLIKSICCLLRQEPAPSIPAGVDVEAVFTAGFLQNMAPLTFCALKDISEVKTDPHFAAWQKRFLDDAMRSEIQLAEYDSLVTYLCANGVKVIPLKGVEIKKLYPSPALRVMSDVDLLYEGVTSKRLSELMTAAGYTVKSIEKHKHDVFHKMPCMNIEAHRKLLLNGERYAVCLEHIAENSVPDRDTENLYHLRPEDLYIHTVVHAAHHLISSGLGVRPLCDIYMIERAYADSWDSGYIRETLAKGGLVEFAGRTSGIARRWFGEGSPDFSNEEERFFFSGGTYGSPMDPVRWNYAVSGKKSGISYILSRAFLPYERMTEKFPVLKKHPFLLPVCRVRYWYAVLRHQSSRVAATAKTVAVSEKECGYAMRIMNALGLE